jgi:hypothetical protein
MKRRGRIAQAAAGLVIAAGVACTAGTALAGATILYEDRLVSVAETLPDPTDLWIPPAELPRVNGFELKPEGACIDDICVPVRQDTDSDIFIRRGARSWFNLVALADRLGQAYAADHETGVWSFGAVPAQRSSLIRDGRAPDFTLPGVDGREYRLSDFKGKKIMLLSWASW